MNKSYKIFLSLALVVAFITCVSLVNKPVPSPPAPSSSGNLVGSGPHYKLYRHKDGNNTIYVAVSNTGGSVSVTK